MGEPIEPDWLRLREPADAAARDRAWPRLRPQVAAWLAATCGPVHVVDIGAGTGANVRWLAPRLTALAPHRPLSVTLLDHDHRLLARVPPGPATRTVHGDLGDLPALLDDRSTLVTASALLDLLTAEQLDGLLADSGHAALLLALSIGSGWAIEPRPEPETTDRLDAAFHEHQARGRALGHRAVDHLRDRRPDGLAAAADWHLHTGRSEQRALTQRFLTDRVAAAVQARPELAAPAADWLARRRDEIERGTLRVRVPHADVWVPPARPRRA